MGAALNFDEFLKLACPPLDLQWRKYRRRAARHRVRARMDELGLGEYGDYLAILREDSQEASSLADLMRVTVSRFFRERALNEARRRLNHDDPDTATVTEVATSLGFDHLGRFSGYYKELFGECPSMTLHTSVCVA